MNMLKTILATSLLTVASFQVNAASVTECGTDVCFTYDNATLFGSANIVGNTINFLPEDFIAESLNGEGAVSVNETLNILVEALTDVGYNMTQFILQETGDYFLEGEGATATVGGMFSATSGTTTCSGDGFFPLACREQEVLNSAPLTTQGEFDNWSLTSVIDISENEEWLSDSKVFLQIENRLSATTLNGAEQAFIQKKSAGIGITVGEGGSDDVPEVPVPAAIWLLGSALGGLGFMRRRKAS